MGEPSDEARRQGIPADLADDQEELELLADTAAPLLYGKISVRDVLSSALTLVEELSS